MRKAAALLLLLTFGFVAEASAASDEQVLVDQARATASTMRRDNAFGDSSALLRRAKAVMIVPRLVKGGFFVGGEGGDGVLVVRGAHGWSDPAFYTMAAASFGLQIGLESAQLVLFVMSDRALQAWMSNEVALGGKAGLAVATIGSNASAAATTNLNADVIAWAKAQGAFAGITLEGSVIKPRGAYNEAYYGKAAMPGDIIGDRVRSNPGATALRSALQ